MARVDEVEGFMKQLYKASIDNEKFTLALVRKFQKLAIRKFCNTGNKDHMQTKGRHSRYAYKVIIYLNLFLTF